jgi:hypothetical protein
LIPPVPITDDKYVNPFISPRKQPNGLLRPLLNGSRRLPFHFDHFFANRGQCNKFCVDKLREHLWKGIMKRFLNQLLGSRSASFKVLLALALVVMTSMQFAAYAQNSMDILQTFGSAETRMGGHSHEGGHHSSDAAETADSKPGLSAEKHSPKQLSADTDCEVHCSPLAAFAPSYFEPMLLPKRSFEPVLHRVLTSSAYDRQARPPKHLI